MGMPGCVITPRANFQTSGCTILAYVDEGFQILVHDKEDWHFECICFES